jgi:hypothetical protein
MHEEKLPTLENGESVYSHVLEIRNGYVSLRPTHYTIDTGVAMVAAE